MNLAAFVYYKAIPFNKRRLRYKALFETIYRNRCRRIVNGLDRRRFDVEVLSTENAFEKDWGVLRIKMARVKRR